MTPAFWSGVFSGGAMAVAAIAFWVKYDERNGGQTPKPVRTYQDGYNAALAVLVETDDNAAIVEAIGTRVLRVVSMGYGYDEQNRIREEFGWQWHDAKMQRANLLRSFKTPREAFTYYKSVRQQADAICEQLDAADTIRKDAEKESAA